MTTNEFERDLNDQAGLKRPGRIDLRVFQNTPDAGDGHPGVQRCFRNYLHEGGMEKDLELVGYSIKGMSVDINNAEMQQLSNIGTVTINGDQWGYVGGADQPVKQADSPTFASPNVTNLNLADDIIHIGDTNNLISFGIDTQDFQTGGGSRLDISDSGVRFGGSNVRVTGIINSDSLGTSDVVLCTQGNVKAYADAHANSDGSSHTYIDQDLKTTFSPTFVGLTLSANLVTTSTVDGVDVGSHTHSGAGTNGVKVPHVNTDGRTVNDHHNQSHVLSGVDHTATGLTIGNVIRASGTTTFAWTQLDHGDLSSIGSSSHSGIDSHISSAAAHPKWEHGTYTGNSGTDKLITVDTNFHIIIVVKTSATQKSWIKLEDLSDANYDAIEIGVGDIEANRIEADTIGFRVWGECNTNGELYTWWGLREGS